MENNSLKKTDALMYVTTVNENQYDDLLLIVFDLPDLIT